MTTRPFSVRGKRVTVAGAARSGVAAAELLVRKGANVTLSEMRESFDEEEQLRGIGVELELGGHREETFTRAELIVTSPGVPLNQPVMAAARQAGVPIMSELELASRWLRGPVVAITGTKGKSTTTTLVGRMLEAGGRRVLVGGNIGLALSAQVGDSTEETIHVVEASSFQLEAIETFRPWIAVLLNFSPDHLDRHAGVEEYAAAKRRIFENQTPGDWMLLNADDPAALAMGEGGRAQRVLFSLAPELAEGFVVSGTHIVQRTSSGEEPLVPLSSIRLLGPHLVADVVAAAAVATLAGVPATAITRAVERFTGLEHALELVGDVGGVRFVNDSKATNIEAARRSIESFDRGLLVIIGGRFKGGSFDDLLPPLSDRSATVIAIGESRGLIRQSLGGRVPVHEARDMSGAVRTAFALAVPGTTVLLAPACASFDMFRDYAERGRVFKQEVSRLKEEWSVTPEQ